MENKRKEKIEELSTLLVIHRLAMYACLLAYGYYVFAFPVMENETMMSFLGLTLASYIFVREFHDKIKRFKEERNQLLRNILDEETR